ncbi:MAG TPA: amidohydrolase family protein [Candidatus Limnocylindria bacterium]|nr:amidohydrolase family protein [Candidatus Limnocylindria bacterium]
MRADGTTRADVGVQDGRIAAIGDVPRAARDLDATGKLVLPGCVDLHTHLASTPTFTPLDDFEHGTRAAIAGGVTTVCSMVYQDGTLRAGIERGLRDAERSLADFAFHVVVTDPSDAAIGELPSLARDGYTGLKVFMVAPRFDERITDYVRLFRAAAGARLLVAVHAEDHGVVARSTAALHAAGHDGVRYFPESRPPEAEDVALRSAAQLAAKTGAAMYFVHLSSRLALAALAEAKARGLRVYGETRPLYLYLTRERFERPDAALWVGQPPLREQADVDAMWKALQDGSVDTVGTDHYPHTRAAKLAPGLAFDRVPPGVANLETLLPMLYSEGVRRGRLTVERMVDVLATAPARIAGLKGKGEIAVGNDADIVIFDPERTRTIRAGEMHSACDYDPYEGWKVMGWPALTLLRGETAYADGEILAKPGAGRLIRRETV